MAKTPERIEFAGTDQEVLNMQLKLENTKLRGLLARFIDECDSYIADSPLDRLIKETEGVLNV